MKDSVYSSIIAYSKSRSRTTDIKVFTDMRYPDYIVNIAYTHLLQSKYDPPFSWLNYTGTRKMYVVNMYIALKNTVIFRSSDCLTYIDQFYEKNSLDEFLLNNIVDYTITHLSLETKDTFKSLWNKVPKKTSEGLITNGKVTPTLLDFIVCVSLFDVKYTRYYIANKIFVKECKNDPIFQIRNLVEFLSIQCPVEKVKKLEFGIYDSFEHIVSIEKSIYGIQHNTKSVKKDLFDDNIKNIRLYYSHVKKSKYDNLETKKILHFFEFNIIQHKWHNFFLYNKVVRNYDDYIVAHKLHGIKNYMCFFSKNDLLCLYHQIENHPFKIIDYLCLSQKNVIPQSYIKDTLKSEILNKDHNTLDFRKQLQEYELDHISFDTHYKILIEGLKAVGANNFIDIFNIYFEKSKICFIHVMSYYYFQNLIDVEQYANLVIKIYKEELMTLKKYDLDDSNYKLSLGIVYLLSSVLFSAKLVQISDILDIIDFVDIKILYEIDFDRIIEFHDGFEAAIKRIIKARDFQMTQYRSKSNFLDMVDIEYILIPGCTNAPKAIDDNYSKLIGYIFNYYDNKNIVMKKIVQCNLNTTTKIDTKDKFINQLLFENKSIDDMIKSFYISVEADNKYYLPRCWKVYLSRNKIIDYMALFERYKTQNNILHCICISAAIYPKNKEFAFDYVRNIEKNTQVILFFKLLFIFYALQHGSCTNIIDFFDLISSLCNTPDNLFLIKLIRCLYKNENCADDAVEQLAKNIENEQPNSNRHNLSLIFTNYDDSTLTACNTIRKIDKQIYNEYRDSSGTMNFIVEHIEADPEFYLQILCSMDKISAFDYSIIEDLVKKEIAIDLITKLLLKHKYLKNTRTIIDVLKTKKQYLMHKKCSELLSRDETLQLINNPQTCVVEFFENVSNMDLTFMIENTFTYIDNHISILRAVANKCKIEKKHLQNPDTITNALLCMISKLEMDESYIDEFIKNIGFIADITSINENYSELKNDKIIQALATQFFVSSNDLKFLFILFKIANYELYYIDIFFDKYNHIKVLQQLKHHLIYFISKQKGCTLH